MNKHLITFIIFLTTLMTARFSSAQDIFVRGKITDKITGEPLSFANVRVMESNMGTSANQDGVFELLLRNGNHRLVVSYLGYLSDTLLVTPGKPAHFEIALAPISLQLPEVTIVPGINPAIRIIQEAIKAKAGRNERISSYSFTAYTKGLIRTTTDISARDNSVSIGVGEDDTLKITGLLENISKGYFQAPNKYREEIIAQKQSANVPSSINRLTGNRIIQSFYNDDIEFLGRRLPGPIDTEALDYYDYLLRDSLFQDNLKVYLIEFETRDKSDPGFYGSVYIADGKYDMLKVDARLNSAANTAGIFEEVRVFQQYLPYEDGIYMPIDYRLFVQINFLGLVKAGFEIGSIMSEYDINLVYKDDFFGRNIQKVVSGAAFKDSLFWKSAQKIPYTAEEISAYTRIDSIESIPVSFWDRFSILSGRINFSDDFASDGLITIYEFNRMRGHQLSPGFYYDDSDGKRLSLNGQINYGFADKRLLHNFGGFYLSGDYRTTKTSFSYRNDQEVIFGESDNYNAFTSTVTSLFGKYDFRSYFYRKAIDADIKFEFAEIFNIRIGYTNTTDNPGGINSDYSFFAKDKTYPVNLPADRYSGNIFRAGVTLDYRNYIEDGFFRRRVSGSSGYDIWGVDFEFANNSIMKSDRDFSKISLSLDGRKNGFRSHVINYRFSSNFSTGSLPVQTYFSLPGNINGLGKSESFRTLKFGEVFGDKTSTLFLEYNFNDDFFRMLSVPLLKDANLFVTFYLSSALTSIRDENLSSLTFVPSEKFGKPFYESGFSIAHPLFPLVFEFTWKLNYRNGNNFTFGINSFAF